MTITATAPPEAGTLQHVDPQTLLLQRNIRESIPSEDLIESIRLLGILEPITAVTTDNGLLVRFGHRRTLAAISADLATVPVYVVGADSDDNEAEVHRVISQFDENTHREGLTAHDKVGVVEQLVAFGLSAEQITKQARVERRDVDHAITVAGSKLARKASAKWDQLTLDQAAAVVEFEDDPDLVKALIVTAVEQPEQFQHAAQRARDDRARVEAIRAATEELSAQGIKVIDPPAWGSKPLRLDHLLTSAGKTLTAKAHATCKGRVAWFNGYNTEPTLGCSNPIPNGHKERYPSGGLGSGAKKAADMTDAEREAAAKARRLVIDNNKAWASAQTVRRQWLSELAKRKAAPKGAAAHIASVIGHDAMLISDYRAGDLAKDWLGVDRKASADLAEKGTDGRALLIALVQVLAAVESFRSNQDWRQNGKTSTAGRHLRFLQSIGYELSDVEKYAVSSKTGA